MPAEDDARTEARLRSITSVLSRWWAKTAPDVSVGATPSRRPGSPKDVHGGSPAARRTDYGGRCRRAFFGAAELPSTAALCWWAVKADRPGGAMPSGIAPT